VPPASGPVTAPLELSRGQILAHRRRVNALERRLPPGADALRKAAWAGLQDSMPRAALLSIHARVEGTQPTTWEDPSLVQVWGPRFSAYVVAAVDVAVFTLGRLSDEPAGLQRAETTADRLEAFLAGRTMSYADAGHAIGMDPNMLRYAAPTGRILIRWEGARRPTIWTVPPPDADPDEAGRELVRRYLTVFGPGTAAGFSDWAGIRAPRASRIFDGLEERTPVRSPIGDGWILASDEPSFRATAVAADPSAVRLLPSGDAWFLFQGQGGGAGQGRDRELLVADPARRGELWTTRVWPGAILVRGEIAGVWRRAGPVVAMQGWRPFTTGERDALVAEAESLPLPDVAGRIRVSFE
jgi:hypothetical protein